MSTKGVIFKRCGCRNPRTKQLLESACSRLHQRGHGSWYFHCSVRTLFGAAERVRRGGYATRGDAQRARDELLKRSREERTTQTWTVPRWLRY